MVVYGQVDVERTIEYILQMQAQFEAGLRQQQEETRQWQEEGKQRIGNHERQIRAIRKLILYGMRTLARTEENLNALSVSLAVLENRVNAIGEKLDAQVEAGRQTDARLDRLIETLQNRFNGHGPSAS